MPFKLFCLLLISTTLATNTHGQMGIDASAFSGSRYPTLMSQPATTPATGHSFYGQATATGRPQPQLAYPVYQAQQPLYGSQREFEFREQSCSTGVCESPCQPPCQSCESCCGSPCDVCGRRFAVNVGAVFMQRQSPESQLLLFSPTTRTERINASGFQFDTAPGLDIGLIAYDIEPLFDLELRATWLDDWSTQSTQTFTGSVVQIDASPPLGTSGPRDAIAVYNSEFLSTELNARYRWAGQYSDLTIVLGLRAIQFDEQLQFTLSDPNAILPDELVQTQTTNRLVGLQLGAEHVFANGSNWCLTFKSRVGLYGNPGRQRSQLVSLANPPVTFRAGGGTGNVAYTAELGITGKYRLSNCLNIVAGYQVMVLDGLALATDQLAVTDFLDQSGYNNDGSVLMHGATVGVEFVF